MKTRAVENISVSNFTVEFESQIFNDFLENEQSANEDSGSEEELDTVDELTLDDIGKLFKVERLGGWNLLKLILNWFFSTTLGDLSENIRSGQ